MSFWAWAFIWAVLLLATFFAYFQIYSLLKAKSLRLNGQLEILQRNLAKLQTEIGKVVELEAPKSAIETGEANARVDRNLVINDRARAKQDRQRSLIRALKKLQRESE